MIEDFARNNPAVMVLLVGIFAGLATFFLWRMLCRMEKKIDEFSGNCQTFREGLMKKKDFEKNWMPGRDEIWKRVNHHKHDQNGNVVIPLGVKEI